MLVTFWESWVVFGILCWWLFVRYLIKELNGMLLLALPVFVWLGWFMVLPIIVILINYLIAWLETSKSLRKSFKSWE